MKVYAILGLMIVSIYGFSQNVGIGTSTPLGEFHVTNFAPQVSAHFTGSGLNDLQVNDSGYTQNNTTKFYVKVSNDGPNPELFIWSTDSSNWSANTAMSTSAITLDYGVTISFSSVTGHIYDDIWQFNVRPDYLDGLIVKDSKVGIGTTSPNKKLDVTGDINFEGDLYRYGALLSIDDLEYCKARGDNLFVGNGGIYENGLSGRNTGVGFQTLYNVYTANNAGYSNCGFGYAALNRNTSGILNVASGAYALYLNISGSSNTAYGSYALYGNTSDNNSAFGFEAIKSNTTGTYNLGVGYRCLNANVSGSNNTAVGSFALFNNNASNNTAVGYYAMLQNTTGLRNIGVGFESLWNNLSSGDNTAVGYQALRSTRAGYNTAFGSLALYSNTTGTANLAVGYRSLYSTTTGDANHAIGYYALSQNSTGGYNTALGYDALYGNTTGNNRTALGYSANSTGNYDNSMGLGYNTDCSAINQVRIGSGVSSIGGPVGWTNTSDVRFKKDIGENVQGLSFILRLRPVTYHFDQHAFEDFMFENFGERDTIQFEGKYDIEKPLFSGFIAQEVEDAAKAIGYDFSGVDAPKNEKDYYGLRYSEFTVPIVKAIQELNAQKMALKMENGELRSRLESLELQNARILNEYGEIMALIHKQ